MLKFVEIVTIPKNAKFSNYRGRKFQILIGSTNCKLESNCVKILSEKLAVKEVGPGYWLSPCNQLLASVSGKKGK